MKRLLEEEGLTLVEIILSIAMLSIVSVVVLRLFIVSYETNEKIRLSDYANTKVISTIEEIKQYDSMENLLNNITELSHHDNNEVYGQIYCQDIESIFNQKDYYLVYAMDENNAHKGLYEINIYIKKENESEPIIQYKTKHYFSKGGESNDLLE